MVRTKFLILGGLNINKSLENSFESDEKRSIKYLNLEDRDKNLDSHQKSIFIIKF